MTRVPDVTEGAEESLAAVRFAAAYAESPRELILAVVPEVESRVDTLLREAVQYELIGASGASRFLAVDNLEDYFLSWSKRKRLLTKVFGFDGFGSSVGQEFELLVDLRNRLMHGNGSITNLQASNLNKLLMLEMRLANIFHVRTLHSRLVLDDVPARKVCAVAVAFLIEVDSAIRRE